MKIEGRRASTNVDDRRGGRRPRRRGKTIGGLLGVLAVVGIGLFFGVDTSQILELMDANQSGGTGSATTGPPANDAEGQFVRVLLADTEDTWSLLFLEEGRQYAPPVLVLFDGSVDSACGYNTSAVGPFYCPADQKAYLDLSFFRDLDQRYEAPGDFAAAYVIAHEIGHHIQNLRGTSTQVHQQQQGLGEAASNALSVRLELQADCYAGVWGFYAQGRGLLEAGDLQEGLTAAAAIGDDRLQERARGYVTPETWTHGASEQRVRWFRVGFSSGQIASCDTFSATTL